jgi:stage IV sporulation protein FB
MSWSITIARVAGSEIRIHLTFLLLLAWIGIAAFFSGGVGAALENVAFIVAIFVCVVLHELGHALAARRYGISTPDITLLPIGGVARLSKLPENPWQEMVIAVAGPLVNVVIAALIILVLGTHLDPSALEALDNPAPGFWARLASVNIFLVLFNLIPAFPMDGGRVLRAALAVRMGRGRATELAAQIGQALAFGFGFLGLISGNPILVFIAIFVYLAAGAEAGQTSLVEIARQVTVGDAMITHFDTLGPTATLADAGAKLIETTQHEFPVVDGSGYLRGMLTRDRLVKSMREKGPDMAVIEVMLRDIPSLERSEKLDRALKLMQEHRLPAVAVTDADGRFSGYVSQENITELWMLKEAGRHGGRRAEARP